MKQLMSPSHGGGEPDARTWTHPSLHTFHRGYPCHQPIIDLADRLTRSGIGWYYQQP